MHLLIQIRKCCLAFIILLTLSCSLLPNTLTSREASRPLPTRTPLPTFTPTSQPTIVVPPTPTPGPVLPAEPPTPVPPEATPTEPPIAEAETGSEQETTDIATPVTEDSVPDLPEPLPTAEVQSSPVEAPVPTEPPPSGPNVTGKIGFREKKNTYAVGEKVFVKIEVTNSQSESLPFGILGLTTSTGTFQTSWSNGMIDGTFTHEDGVAFSRPGTHKLWLSICYSPEQICQGPDGEWQRFEPGLDVTIQ